MIFSFEKNFKTKNLKSLINPNIASPCYLSESLPLLCNLMTTNGFQQLAFIKVLSTLPSVDMLQLVRNMQQAITIRVVEFGDDDEECGSLIL